MIFFFPFREHYNLRAIILKLQDYLSNNDRQRLHFFLGDNIRRQIRDDRTLNGTFKLMKTLVYQDKISEQNFTFFINAFETIQCFEAAKFLASMSAFDWYCFL